MLYTTEQHNAINADHQKCLCIVASAGAGKTTVIAARAKRLVELGIPPEKILTTTFTLKSCQDLKDKMAGVSEKIIVTNLHKLAFKICKDHGGDYKVIDTVQQKEVIRIVADGLEDKPGNCSVKDMQKKISGFRAKMISPEDFGDVDNFFKDLLIAYEEYCHAHKLLDFDAIILQAVKILENDTEARAFEQAKYAHIFVDEYQDVNKAQETLLGLLKAPDTFSTTVGDEEQSIYRFRGASSEFFTSYPARNNANTVFLTKNFRSTGSIVEAARAAINSSKRLHSNDTPMISRTKSVRKCMVKDDVHEGMRIAQEIIALAEEGVNLGEVAVLYRTHTQAKYIEEALLKCNLPYQVKGATSFWNHKEIQAALAMISFAVRPCMVSFMTVAKHFKGVGEVSIKKAWNANQDTPFLEIGGDVAHVQQSIERLRKATSSDDISAVLFDHANFGELISEDDGYSDRNERLLFLSEAIDRIFESTSSIGELLELLSLTRETALDSSLPSVQLMTIHSAKGLEFDVVFIAGVVNGVFPGSRDRVNMVDEERLLFVGMTRPKKLLYMVGREDRSCTFIDRVPTAFDVTVPPFSKGLLDNEEFPESLLKANRKELKNTLLMSKLHLNDKAKTMLLNLREKLGDVALDALTLSDIEIGLIKLIIPNGFKVKGEAPNLSNLAKAFLRKQADAEVKALLA